ncbi:hypothetical protein HK100_009775, partial [Physocladia obscura]
MPALTYESTTTTIPGPAGTRTADARANKVNKLKASFKSLLVRGADTASTTTTTYVGVGEAEPAKPRQQLGAAVAKKAASASARRNMANTTTTTNNNTPTNNTTAASFKCSAPALRQYRKSPLATAIIRDFAFDYDSDSDDNCNNMLPSTQATINKKLPIILQQIPLVQKQQQLQQQQQEDFCNRPSPIICHVSPTMTTVAARKMKRCSSPPPKEIAALISHHVDLERYMSTCEQQQQQQLGAKLPKKKRVVVHMHKISVEKMAESGRPLAQVCMINNFALK